MLTIAQNVPSDDLKTLRVKALKEGHGNIVKAIDTVLRMRESGQAKPKPAATLKRITETTGPDPKPIRKPAPKPTARKSTAAERNAAVELLIAGLTLSLNTAQFCEGLHAPEPARRPSSARPAPARKRARESAAQKMPVPSTDVFAAGVRAQPPALSHFN